ncbi:Y-family DNA polymerase [Camelimonas lactis]|uniref:Protein ImuB n=1 Tax=Camelimonas lactis TaxID=659006 RepID=A0A4R2GKY3_9HYPH|nr:DNA polymerase Y family protein [Camelimonas lactis]TCO09495.1 protein ImuB [Camelimonas lactis]
MRNERFAKAPPGEAAAAYWAKDTANQNVGALFQGADAALPHGARPPRRRYLALWFPFLPADRLRRQAGSAATNDGGKIANGDKNRQGAPPLVFVAPVRGAMRLVAVSPEALAAGLRPQMTLADARALAPALWVVPARPDLDDAFLTRLRDDFERFTPLLAIDPPHGLVLDITGCAHLAGGEAPMAARVRQRAHAAGLHVHCALAATPQAARALARFTLAAREAPLIVPEGGDRAATARLPVAALELSEGRHRTLQRAGLKRLADIIDRDSVSLASRFGAAFPARLARITGAEDIRITPERPAPPCVIDRILPEPVAREEHVEALLAGLLRDAAQRLEQAGQGGLRFTALFYRTDGVKRAVTVSVSQPTRDPALVGLLLRERLGALDDPLDPGFGFDQIRLCVGETAPLAAMQSGLPANILPATHILEAGQEDISRLADRLAARLGPEAVLKLCPRGSHLPERAAVLRPARLASAGVGWRDLAPEDPPARPLHLFRTPQPVEAMDAAPDGYPLRFRWRRMMHDVAAAEGPERLSPEWWRTLPAAAATPPDDAPADDAHPLRATRDYYRVEDREGRRFWLFRPGDAGATAARWFIHGLFP